MQFQTEYYVTVHDECRHGLGNFRIPLDSRLDTKLFVTKFPNAACGTLKLSGRYHYVKKKHNAPSMRHGLFLYIDLLKHACLFVCVWLSRKKLYW